MRYLWLSIAGLTASISSLCFALLRGDETYLYVASVLAWAALIASCALVQHFAPTARSRRIVHFQLGAVVLLPVFSCAWAPIAWILTAMVGTPYGDPDVVLLLMTGIPLSLAISTNTAIALRSPFAMGLWLLLAALSIASAFCMKKGDARNDIEIWEPLAITVLTQIAAVCLRTKGRGPRACMKCGYDLSGLSTSTLCPECGVKAT
jgi:hypothetical protein